MKPAVKVSLLYFYSWYSVRPPSPCPGSSQFIWLARAPPRKTLPTADKVRLDRAAYDVCPMRAKENQTHSAALSGYDDSPRISVLPGSAEFLTMILNELILGITKTYSSTTRLNKPVYSALLDGLIGAFSFLCVSVFVFVFVFVFDKTSR